MASSDTPFDEVTIADGVACAVVHPEHARRLCEGHFPGEPIVPGASLAGLMADLGARLLAARGAVEPRLARVDRCVFRVTVRPDERIVVAASADGATVEAEVRTPRGRAAAATLRFAGVQR